MYLSHYGLGREPFHITPDPDFLYLSPSHREAFATVVYGVEKRKGFVALTGEVGVGKTTVLRAYLKRVENSPVRPIYIFNPDLTFEQLLGMLLRALDEEPADAPESAMIERIHWRLIEAYKRDENVALIIDEAQNMPVETLEKLRMLSNLETTTDKLIQIVLVGQPELERKLELHQLRQLRQRLAVRARVKTLSAAESREYIQHRLTQAGAAREDIFTPGAVRAMVRHAKGNPRIINIVADNALIAGFGNQASSVTRRTVREVIADLEGGASRARRWALAVAGLAVLVAAAAAIGSWMGASPRPQATDRHVAHAEAPADAVETRPAPIDGAVSPAPAPQPPVGRRDHRAITLDFMTRTLEPAPKETPPATQEAPVRTAPDSAVQSLESPAPEETSGTTLINGDSESVNALTETASARVTPEKAKTSMLDGAVQSKLATVEADLASAAVSVLETPAETVARVVEKGDTLTQLIRDFYGHSGPELIEAVVRLNPHISNPDYIMAGDTLVFPVGRKSESGGESAAAMPGVRPEDRKRP